MYMPEVLGDLSLEGYPKMTGITLHCELQEGKSVRAGT